MTWDEYFQFLEEYWSLFPPPQEPRPKIVYTKILI